MLLRPSRTILDGSWVKMSKSNKQMPEMEKLPRACFCHFETTTILFSQNQKIGLFFKNNDHEQVRIDLGRGMFAPGQAYVALSRCRTLDGISFNRPLSMDDIKCDPVIQAFYQSSDVATI